MKGEIMDLDFALRIFIAGMLGGVIGLEREYRAKEAGFRTHFLVSLGSALFMILSHSGFDLTLQHTPNVSLDPSRIASQVVTGIGFIGAGIIIFQKHVVHGLTTAAGLWVTSAIGLTCGSGMYVLAVSATVMVLICLEALHLILRKIGTRNILLTLSAPTRHDIKLVLQDMKAKSIKIVSYEMQEKAIGEGKSLMVATIELKLKKQVYENCLLQFMEEYDGVDINKIE